MFVRRSGARALMERVGKIAGLDRRLKLERASLNPAVVHKALLSSLEIGFDCMRLGTIDIPVA